jgi:hypothetical protein
MGWRDEEFGSSHDGKVGVLLADGSEPKPVYVDPGPVHGVSDWQIYDGYEYSNGYARPRAAWLRGACSCGWRGERHKIDWACIEDWPDDVDTSGPYGDWGQHIGEVESQAVPLPEDVKTLLEQLEDRLSTLGEDAPLAALRTVAAVERLAKRVGWQVAFDAHPDETPWDEMGKALGISGTALRARLHDYAPDDVRSGFWTESGTRLV